MDREYAIARRSHEYLLQHPTWPTEWILQALSIAWYDYLYTGDSRSLESSYELLKPRILMALREKNGLISTTTGLQTDDFLRSIRFRDRYGILWTGRIPEYSVWGRSKGEKTTDLPLPIIM